MKIYCFGNEFVKEDSLAKEICDEITAGDVKFVKVDNVSAFMDNPPDELTMLDVVQNLAKPDILSVDELLSSPGNAHDLDLAFYLKLLKETGRLKKIRIIGIPPAGNKENIKKEIKKLLSMHS